MGTGLSPLALIIFFDRFCRKHHFTDEETEAHREVNAVCPRSLSQCPSCATPGPIVRTPASSSLPSATLALASSCTSTSQTISTKGSAGTSNNIFKDKLILFSTKHVLTPTTISSKFFI